MRLTTVLAVFSLIGCMSGGVPAPAGDNNTGQTKPRAENAQKTVDELFLFKQPIDTSVCAVGSDGKKLRKYPTTIQKIGAVVHSKVYTQEEINKLQSNEIGLFVVPYIINFLDQKLFLVVAKAKRVTTKDNHGNPIISYSRVGSFVPPCDNEADNQKDYGKRGHSQKNAVVVENNLRDYPILVLPATQQSSFESFCQQGKEDGFCKISEMPFTTGALLSLVFEKNPPDFLKDIKPGQLRLRPSDNKDNEVDPPEEEDGSSNKTKRSIPLPTQITGPFTKDHAKYLTVDGQGCVLKYPNVECDAQPPEQNPVTLLKIKGFNDIQIPLPKEKELEGLNFTINTQIGETKGTCVFPISTIGNKACVSVDSVTLCTEKPISVEMVVNSETTPIKLVPQKKEERENQTTRQPTGQHKLIVVSLSNGFGPKGKIIQESLREALTKLCKNKPDQANFTLLAIESGRKRVTVLNSQELADKLCQTVDNKENNLLLKQIENGMSFSAEDLRSIDDLELVDSFIADRPVSQNANEQVGKVLYLTDDGTLPEKIPRKQLGVPLAWKNDNIVLEVVTTKSCTPWQEQAKVRETLCFQWNQDKVKSSGKDVSLSQLIETFLQNLK
jgi:hypothetical protein